MHSLAQRNIYLTPIETVDPDFHYYAASLTSDMLFFYTISVDLREYAIVPSAPFVLALVKAYAMERFPDIRYEFANFIVLGGKSNIPHLGKKIDGS